MNCMYKIYCIYIVNKLPPSVIDLSDVHSNSTLATTAILEKCFS